MPGAFLLFGGFTWYNNLYRHFSPVLSWDRWKTLMKTEKSVNTWSWTDQCLQSSALLWSQFWELFLQSCVLFLQSWASEFVWVLLFLFLLIVKTPYNLLSADWDDQPNQIQLSGFKESCLTEICAAGWSVIVKTKLTLLQMTEFEGTRIGSLFYYLQIKIKYSKIK